MARRVLLAASIAGLAMLAVTAVALNVKTDGGDVLDFVAGMLVPVVLALPVVAAIAALHWRRRARPGRASPWSSRLGAS